MIGMRRGFTMIELIFVIVIIGILAAVAIPKLAATASEARKSTITGFLGTLNRTVGPTMWGEAVSTDGTVSGNGANPAFNLANYTDIPTGVTITGLGGCGVSDGNASNGEDYGKIGDISTAILAVAEELYCLDGTNISSPKFAFDVNGSQVLVNN